MPNKEFLETYQLYRGIVLNIFSDYSDLEEIPKPAVHMYCSVCKSDQTYNMINEYRELEHPVGYGKYPAIGKVVRCLYICTGCHASNRYFFLLFGVSRKENEGKQNNYLSVCKIGQLPAWEITPDKTLEKLLGKHADLYKKGLVCESQSYGVGAYAYYRRIVENIIDELLNSILDIIPETEKQAYEAALAETKKSKVTQDKIKLVKDLLPASLKPEGFNPLNILHSILSDGVHNETDEDCLEQANEIKSSLIFLVNQIERTKQSSKEFTEGMRKLLEKKKSK